VIMSLRSLDRLHVIYQTRVLKWSDSDSGGFDVLKLGQVADYQSNLLQGRPCEVGFEVGEIAKSDRYTADLTISYSNKIAIDHRYSWLDGQLRCC